MSSSSERIIVEGQTLSGTLEDGKKTCTYSLSDKVFQIQIDGKILYKEKAAKGDIFHIKLKDGSLRIKRETPPIDDRVKLLFWLLGVPEEATARSKKVYRNICDECESRYEGYDGYRKYGESGKGWAIDYFDFNGHSSVYMAVYIDRNKIDKTGIKNLLSYAIKNERYGRGKNSPIGKFPRGVLSMYFGWLHLPDEASIALFEEL